MEDSYANLIYQGKKSSDLGVLIQYPFNLTHPIPDIDPTHIKGRSGDFLQSDNSYQNVTETFNCIIPRQPGVSQFDTERQIIDWLASPVSQGRKQYQYLQFDVDPEYVYNAILQNPPVIQWNENTDTMATGQITFYCEPFQYRINGIDYVPLPDNGTVINEELQNAVPNWHFIANGTFILNVNGYEYEFDNMSGEFWLNGDTGDTYDSKNNLFNSQIKFPNLAPPKLIPGKNTITITADSGSTITKAEYMPRWRRLI